MSILNKIVRLAPAPLKKRAWKIIYNRLAKTSVKFNRNTRFINLGFVTQEKITLLEQDEPYRLHIQLYNELLKGGDINGKSVLEIGCGFGGGCYVMANYHKPLSVTGIDLLDRNIAICRKTHSGPKVQFYERDAEHTGFTNELFDIIINLESSNSYPSRDTKFCAEVVRLLKPGGYFLYGDMFPDAVFKSFTRALLSAGMVKLSERDITDGVMESRRQLNETIKIEYMPFWMPKSMYKDFMVSTDSAAFNAMAEKRIAYKLFVFRKEKK